MPQTKETKSPPWYKEAIIYEVSIRAFYDSNGDGIGDLQGLTEKLDYLQSLGITAIWLLPFYPSPMKDGGYDISDYTGVHPMYGDIDDFKRFVQEAHRRGLRVIIEMVTNHTSDQHPWFQRARQAEPGTLERDVYVWSDTPDKYPEVPVLFKDFETSNWAWDPVAKAYYWHRFYSYEPDLNYDNPEVYRAMFQAIDFWLELGVDGLRLATVPYLYEREGTDGENLPETHNFLKDLRQHIDQKFEERVLIAVTNQWPDIAATYLDQGEECHMAFYDPLMPRLFMTVRMEDRFPVVDMLRQTPPIPDNCQWAFFLRNHDELTLEIATSSERDYMYRVYASDPQFRLNLGIRRRLAPLLENDRRRIELMNGLLFSLPGTPVLYYGDEIGMGDNVYLPGRNGIRTPMQWSSDRNAGFSQGNPQRLYLPVIIDPQYHYHAVNVETQQNNPSSLLWWMRRLTALRKRHPAFSHGSLEFLYPENHRVFAFLRRHQDETILVVANLSRFVQHAELDLSPFKEQVPFELFGRNELPPIGELPYLVTLSPYSFYWFALQPQQIESQAEAAGPVETTWPTLAVPGAWEEVLQGQARAELEAALPGYIAPRRWFGSKARTISSTTIVETLPIAGTGYLVLISVDYTEGEPETYVLPLAYASGDQGEDLRRERPAAVVCFLETGQETGILYDAVWNTSFCRALLETIAGQQQLQGTKGQMLVSATHVFPQLYGQNGESLTPFLMEAEQSNTSIRYGERLIMKLYRRLESGTNPDLEIGYFLTEKANFAHIPPVAGAMEYRWAQTQPDGQAESPEPVTLAILQGFVPNQGDAWRFTLDVLSRYFERVMSQFSAAPTAGMMPQESLLALSQRDIPILAHEMIGGYIEAARLLGQRTAELHLALASDAGDRAFAPEPFTPAYRRPLHQEMRNLAGRILQLLRQRQRNLPPEVQPEARQVLNLEGEILQRFHSLLEADVTALRTRIHGDYHLGQVLYTGRDFMIIDFEGEPARSLSERRTKRSPLQDVAGMLRSFHYAAYAAFFDQVSQGMVPSGQQDVIEAWTRFWYLWVSVAFLKTYLDLSDQASFRPKSEAELQILLNAFLLEKAVYELGYELNNRPDWVKIPLQGILQTLQALG